MKFSTDHYFQIGHVHYTAGKPCQDHALSRFDEHIACAIVSDGCSTGGNTDMGARILTFGTLQAIQDHAVASNGALGTAAISITARQQQLIGVVRPVIGMERGDMLATCIFAYFTSCGGLVHIQGDGVVALKYRNGLLCMHRFEWDDNTPFYPSYIGNDLVAFVAFHGGDISGLRLHESIVSGISRDEYKKLSRDLSVKRGIEGISLNFSQQQMEDIEYVAIFTDGVTQIQNVDWQEAVADFLAFKSTAGEFAKRRMIHGVKAMQKIGKGPIDDIAYAVIHIEPEEIEKENG